MQSGKAIQISLLLLVAGCTATGLPELPRGEVPAGWAHSVNTPPQAPAVDAASWWKHLHDPQLDQLVEQALTGNLTLEQARTRLMSARELLGHSGDEFLPQVHARAQPVDSPDATRNYYQYGLDAVWELDLFGRGDASRKLAQASLAGAAAEVEAARVSITAEVVRTWLELRAYQQQLLATQRQQQLQQDKLQLLAARVAARLPAQAEQVQAQQQLGQLRNSELTSRMRIDAATQRLALLLGRTNADAAWLQPGEVPKLAAFTVSAVPAESLRSRPELRSAEAAVLAAAGRLGVAQAELYPHISLGASFIYAADVTHSNGLGNANHTPLAVGPLIDIPLFDWGQRRAAVQAGERALQEALLGYRATVLEAVNETETALGSLQWQQQIYAQANENLAALQKHQALVEQRIGFGFASRLDLLAAQERVSQAQLEVLDAGVAHSLAFVALYKSLGGSALPAGEVP